MHIKVKTIRHIKFFELGPVSIKPIQSIANPTKWSNTFKQLVGKSQRIVGVFDHFVELALKELKLLRFTLC